MFNKKQSSGRGRVRKAVGAMAAALALVAVLSSNASAFEASPTVWYTGAWPGTKLVGTEAATMSNRGERFWISGSIYTAPVKLVGTGIECVGCVIENSGSSALIKGKLRFTGVTLEGLAGCNTSPTIETKPLVGTVVGGPPTGPLMALRWAAASGTAWANIEVTGTCPFGGLYKLSGSATGLFANARNVFNKNQPITFNREEQEYWGGALLLGGEPAYPTAENNTFLSSGKEFGVKSN